MLRCWSGRLHPQPIGSRLASQGRNPSKKRVVNAWDQAREVPNLFVCDGSMMTAGAAANPTLAIVALAIRQAGHIAEKLKSGVL